MRKLRFVERIPKRPVLKRKTYIIPLEYKREYESSGIKSLDE